MMRKKRMQKVIRLDAVGGWLILLALALAMLIANTPWQTPYQDFLRHSVTLPLGFLKTETSRLSLLNQCAMSLVFFRMGFQTRREFKKLDSTSKSVVLPAFAAFGGLVIPMVIYFIYNWNVAGFLDGILIPSATDVSLGLVIVSLLYDRLPAPVVSFLMTLAILTTMSVLLLMTLAHPTHLPFLLSVRAGVLCVILFLLMLFKLKKPSVFVLVGGLLWLCLFESPLHCVLAASLIAFVIPLPAPGSSAVSILEQRIQAIVTFVVLPVFILANAGISFKGTMWELLGDPVAVGIWLGVLLGKPLGIFLASWGAVKLKLAKLPRNLGWEHLYGIGLLAGIILTPALFIGSFAGSDYSEAIRYGSLFASFLSATLGYLVLKKWG